MLFRANEVEEEDNDVSKMMFIKERIAKFQKTNDHRDKYMSCVLIVESAAGVESVWSSSVYILSNYFRSLTPRMFEALVFFRYYEKYCNLKLVFRVLSSARRSLEE